MKNHLKICPKHNFDASICSRWGIIKQKRLESRLLFTTLLPAMLDSATCNVRKLLLEGQAEAGDWLVCICVRIGIYFYVVKVGGLGFYLARIPLDRESWRWDIIRIHSGPILVLYICTLICPFIGDNQECTPWYPTPMIPYHGVLYTKKNPGPPTFTTYIPILTHMAKIRGVSLFTLTVYTL